MHLHRRETHHHVVQVGAQHHCGFGLFRGVAVPVLQQGHERRPESFHGPAEGQREEFPPGTHVDVQLYDHP